MAGGRVARPDGITGFEVRSLEELFQQGLVAQQWHDPTFVVRHGEVVGFVELDAVDPGLEKPQGAPHDDRIVPERVAVDAAENRDLERAAQLQVRTDIVWRAAAVAVFQRVEIELVDQALTKPRLHVQALGEVVEESLRWDTPDHRDGLVPRFTDRR